MTRGQAEKILKTNFGVERFYDRQWEVIQELLEGKKILLIEKTGFGKSLCFQFPSIIFNGLTVVFSPLIALMRDQIKRLQNTGIPSACINSEQSADENNRLLHEARTNKIKILYIAPERQESNLWIDAVKELKLSMIVIDEAHCISMWGHDFRPSFRRIAGLVKQMPKGFPVLAATATATKKVEQDIAEQISDEPVIFRGSLARDNFKLYVVKLNSDDEKMIWMENYIKKLPGSGIIYTGTRADTHIISNWLNYINIPSTPYNAGLDPSKRKEVEQGLLDNKWKCIISTNALGMGIDKPDIRFIIHTQFPPSPVHYYQEIGRAGRDGNPTNIILLYNPEDKDLPMAFAESTRPSPMKYFEVLDKLKKTPLTEYEIITKTNLRNNQARVIISDLIEQGIIYSNNDRKKYEFINGSPILDFSRYEILKQKKYSDIEDMMKYAETTESRMRFLCNYLGDEFITENKNCDNSGLSKMELKNEMIKESVLNQFQYNFFPELDVSGHDIKLVNGVAGSYYGISDIGAIIHKCKYENGGDFPSKLIELTVRAFKFKFNGIKFDHIIFIPPTKSGDLVKNFVIKLSRKIKTPVLHDLRKTRRTEEQKIFENVYAKTMNLTGAFEMSDTKKIKGKKILLVDDIFDSGVTIIETGKYLIKCGAELIAPLTIAKTVGGDITKN